MNVVSHKTEIPPSTKSDLTQAVGSMASFPLYESTSGAVILDPAPQLSKPKFEQLCLSAFASGEYPHQMLAIIVSSFHGWYPIFLPIHM